MAFPSGPMQRRLALFDMGVHIGPDPHQKTHHLHMAPASRPMQTAVHLSPDSHQKTHRLYMAPASRPMQRRLTLLGVGIHISPACHQKSALSLYGRQW